MMAHNKPAIDEVQDVPSDKKCRPKESKGLKALLDERLGTEKSHLRAALDPG